MLTTTTGSGMTTREIIMFSNKTRDKKWLGPMLQGQVIRKGMLEIYLSATSANITTLDLAPLYVGTAKGSFTRLKIVGSLPR